MNDRKLLIVGIDPGITTAYAVLDIDLNLIDVKSSKELNLNKIISNILGLGKVILVGTDKAKIPHLVEDFAAKFGANIANPKEDLGVEEKKSIAANFIVENGHQADALASALFAYKSIKSLLDKIDHFVEENKKQNIRNKIKELVILNKISIKSAVSLIENKDKEEQIIEKVVVEKKLNQSDFLSLYDKLKKYESEIKLMRKYNNDLKNRISNLLAERAKEPKPINKKPINFSEKTIRSLQNKIRIMEKEAFQYRASIKKFNELISNIKNFHTLKKLNNLGFKEFSFKNKILNIQPNDILLVDDINIYSADVVKYLKNRVFIIVHKKPVSGKIKNELPFVFVKAENLKIYDNGSFAFADKKEFEQEKNRVNWVGKIVDDYKKEKELLFS